MGFLVVTSVLVTTLGRLGDIYGRVRMYNLGFAVFTFFSLLLTVTWMSGHAAGIWLIVMRIFQGVGAAMLMANSAAILTDAFPRDSGAWPWASTRRRPSAASFIGLVLGGVLAPINWRLIFLVSVPIGLFGTVWGYLKLRELSERQPAKIDWPGNITFALGLILVMVGITYGIEPYRHDTMGWTNPFVLPCSSSASLLLVAFGIIETKVEQPMFRLQLFKIRAFTAGVFASFLAALSRGGLMFMLIIWLQGIWLPLHGYDFARTPLWAGLAMLPLTAGFLIAGPLSGILSDRYGARPFATGGMIGAAVCFVLLRAAADRLPLLALRRPALRHRALHVHVRLPEPGRRHEQPSARASWRRIGDEHHLPELGPGPLHRDLLHAADRRALRFAARSLYHGLVAHGVSTSGGDPRLAPAAGLHPLRRLLGLQPGAAPARGHVSCPISPRPTGDAHRAELLPRAHHRAVPGRPARRARLRHRGQPAGGRGSWTRGRSTVAPLYTRSTRASTPTSARRRRLRERPSTTRHHSLSKEDLDDHHDRHCGRRHACIRSLA